MNSTEEGAISRLASKWEREEPVKADEPRFVPLMMTMIDEHDDALHTFAMA